MSKARTTRKNRELRSGMVRRNEVQSKHIWCFLLALIVAQLAAMRLVCISKVGGRKKERLSTLLFCPCAWCRDRTQVWLSCFHVVRRRLLFSSVMPNVRKKHSKQNRAITLLKVFRRSMQLCSSNIQSIANLGRAKKGIQRGHIGQSLNVHQDHSSPIETLVVFCFPVN